MAPPIKVSATDDDLRHLREHGWTYQDIAEAFGVSISAIYQRYAAMGETGEYHRNRLTQHLRVAQEHKDAAINSWLRTIDHMYLNKEEGRPVDEGLSDRQVSQARSFLSYLHEENLIVVYSREQGWYLTDREASDGDAEVVVRAA